MSGGPWGELRQRTLARASRDVHRLWARTRYPAVRFGDGCDIRSGLRLRVAPGAAVEFGPSTVLDRCLTVECAGRLSVGARTVFGHHVTIAVHDEVTIGDSCLIAELVSIRDHDHSFDDLHTPILDQGATSSPVRIGPGVWIGSKATVTRGVTIGKGAVVGAGAVVTHDLPDYAVAVGVPARVIRFRDRPS